LTDRSKGPRCRVVSWVRHWGSTAAERADSYPCDELLTDADLVLYRAVNIRAPAPAVYRWLCQLRIAPYSYDWIDNWGRQSPPTLVEGLDRLEPGQPIMMIFRLAAFTPGEHLTIILVDRWARAVFGEIAGTYQVVARPGGSRLIVKLLARRPRGPFRWLAPLLPLGDLIMMRRQLLNLGAHAERSAPSREPARLRVA
jgi:hypothetical protein